MKKEIPSNTFILLMVASFLLALASVWLCSFLFFKLPEWGKMPSVLSGFLLFVTFSGFSVAAFACAVDAIKREKKE